MTFYGTPFYTKVLQGIGAPVTPANLAVLRSWEIAEGGTAGTGHGNYNPFNSSQVVDRTTGKDRKIPTTQFKNTNVVNYANLNDGVAATVTNLKLGYYDDVVKALQASSPLKAIAAIVDSPWAGGHYWAKTDPNGGYLASTSSVFKVYMDDNGPNALTPEQRDELENRNWIGGIADNITPDNLGEIASELNPLAAVTGFISSIQGGIGFLTSHWKFILMGILGGSLVLAATLFMLRKPAIQAAKLTPQGAAVSAAVGV